MTVLPSLDGLMTAGRSPSEPRETTYAAFRRLAPKRFGAASERSAGLDWHDFFRLLGEGGLSFPQPVLVPISRTGD